MNTQKMKALSKSIFIASLLGGVALPVAAQKHYKGQRHGDSHQAYTSYDYAKVVGVQPVFQTHQVNHPIEQCYQKQVPVKQRYSSRGKDSYTNEIIGGVIGAVAGNQIGKRGRGNTRGVATVVGAVVGASVARGVEKNSHRGSSNGYYQKSRFKTIEHCELQDSYTTKRELVGYDVAYKYNGRVYHTQLDQRPGKKIKVKVAVKPV